MVEHGCVISIRAARRYSWRLAGGRLVIDDAVVQFVPNPLERRRAGAHWQCKPGDVTAARVRGRIWLVLETTAGTQNFRVFRAARIVARVNAALGPAPM